MVLDNLDGGAGVPSVPQRGSNDLVHRPLQLLVDLPDPGQLGIDLPPAAGKGLLPAAAALLQPLGGPIEHAGFVSHGLSLLVPFLLLPEKGPHPLQILPHPPVHVAGGGGVVLHGGPAAGGEAALGRPGGLVPRLDLRQGM